MEKPTIEQINNASHEQLCRWWRFLPGGALQKGDPVTERLKARLFEEFDGFTPTISKRIGWEQ